MTDNPQETEARLREIRADYEAAGQINADIIGIMPFNRSAGKVGTALSHIPYLLALVDRQREDCERSQFIVHALSHDHSELIALIGSNYDFYKQQGAATGGED